MQHDQQGAVDAGSVGHGFILDERARAHHWAGSGLLSLKTFCGGTAFYDVGGGHFAVDDGHYLLLNHGQHYAVSIESPAPVESFCVFFDPALVADVAHALSHPPAALLEQPSSAGGPLPTFFARTYPFDRALPTALGRVRTAVRRGAPPEQLEERLTDLLARLLLAQQTVRTEIEALSASRPATRAETYRRAHLARDYALAHLDEPLPLARLAAAVALSPTHLLRVFREVFGQSPHHYLTTARLERARRLLQEGDAPVTTISLSVGFQSVGSFSDLFRRRFGLSPRAYRALFRSGRVAE